MRKSDINMERYVQTLGDKPQAEVFSNTIKQIKTATVSKRVVLPPAAGQLT